MRLDDETTRARLTQWLKERLVRASDIEIDDLRTPRSTGFSGNTLLFQASWAGSERRRRMRLVARIAPTPRQAYPQARFLAQYRVQRTLAERTSIPVPRVLWYESDPAVFGAPFYVMEYVPGLVPGDLPSYHREGWLVRLPQGSRAALWLAGVEVMRQIHQVELEPLRLEFLTGRGMAGELAAYERHLGFVAPEPAWLVEATLGWLHDNLPAPTPGEMGLLWGDARIGNIVYSGRRVSAVLDWEMAAVGPPEADVAWFLYRDRHLSEGVGLPRLPGLPGAAETIAHYEALADRRLHDLRYYEVFAGLRFLLLTARVNGSATSPPGLPLQRSAARLLAATLDRHQIGIGR